MKLPFERIDLVVHCCWWCQARRRYRSPAASWVLSSGSGQVTGGGRLRRPCNGGLRHCVANGADGALRHFRAPRRGCASRSRRRLRTKPRTARTPGISGSQRLDTPGRRPRGTAESRLPGTSHGGTVWGVLISVFFGTAAKSTLKITAMSMKAPMPDANRSTADMPMNSWSSATGFIGVPRARTLASGALAVETADEMVEAVLACPVEGALLLAHRDVAAKHEYLPRETAQREWCKKATPKSDVRFPIQTFQRQPGRQAGATTRRRSRLG